MDRTTDTPPVLISRRQAMRNAGLGLFGVVAAACGLGGDEEQVTDEPQTQTDFSTRFAGFQVADEPNGDSSKVVWPDYVKRAGPEVQRLYEFQIENGDLMKFMPCFCGCGADEHRNNRDCYVKQVNSDGSVVLDSMAPVCDICLGVTRQVIEMKARGMTPRQIRIAIDTKHADVIELSTPTPYPPA